MSLEASRSIASPFPRCVLAGLVCTLAQPLSISPCWILAGLSLLQGGHPFSTCSWREGRTQCRPLAQVQAWEGSERAMVESRSTSPVPFPQMRARMIIFRNSCFCFPRVGRKRAGWKLERESPALLCHFVRATAPLGEHCPLPQALELPAQSVRPCAGVC